MCVIITQQYKSCFHFANPKHKLGQWKTKKKEKEKVLTTVCERTERRNVNHGYK